MATTNQTNDVYAEVVAPVGVSGDPTQVNNVYGEVIAAVGSSAAAAQANDVYAEVIASLPVGGAASQVNDAYSEVISPISASGAGNMQADYAYAEVIADATKETQLNCVYLEVIASFRPAYYCPQIRINTM